jgi:dolichol-phosphate mannosyltransferase
VPETMLTKADASDRETTVESSRSVRHPKLSVLMPVFNEEETIRHIIADVLAIPVDLELIVVDDGSTDMTRDRLNDIAPDERLRIIYTAKNAGKGAAIRVALSHAVGDVVVIQDADREYDPNDFIVMLEKIDSGAAVVYGSRLSHAATKLNDEGKRDRFYYGRRLLPFVTNLLYRTGITDEATCYKMFRRDVLVSIPLTCERFDFCPEVTAKVAKRGYKIYEVPIHYEARTAAEGKKIGWRDAFDAIWALLKFRVRD